MVHSRQDTVGVSGSNNPFKAMLVGRVQINRVVLKVNRKLNGPFPWSNFMITQSLQLTSSGDFPFRAVPTN